MSGKITIRDVAAKAGVSVATVSRVMNSPDIVVPEKRDAVLRAISELHYAPNPVARAMGGKNTDTIAIIVPGVISDIIAEIVDGIMTEAEKGSFSTLLFSSGESVAREKQLVNSFLQEKLISGAVFISSNGLQQDFEPLLRTTPVVTINRFEAHPQLSTVSVDDAGGFALIVEHLKSLGHRRFGYLAGDLSRTSGQKLLSKLLTVMTQQDLELPWENIVSCDWTSHGGYEACGQLLAQKADITALLSASDILSIGAISALWDQGIRVPEDISVAGFDSFPISEFSVPSLTTLQYPYRQMGRIATAQLIKQITNPLYPIKNYVLPLKLIQRKSTGNAKIDK
ncbi:MAG: LacI family DNA-binding transcriptional regulator [Oscillospiraceae bacterium]|nr:LacI family DNA-binding transcriptional regulator [Oscillospiraceae bacterium]